MTLRQRLALIGGVAALLLVVAGLTSLAAAAHWSDKLNERRDLLVGATTVERLRAAYSDQETGERGFALTGNETFLDPYNSGQQRADQALAELDGLAARYPEMTAMRAAVTQAAGQWRVDGAKPEMDAASQGGGSEAAAPIVANGRSKALFDNLRARLDDLGAQIDTLVATAQDQALVASRLMFAVLAAAIVISVATTLLVGVLLHRWIGRPLVHLADAISHLRQGDVVAVPIEGPPEVRSVAVAIDALQRQVRLQRDEAVHAREALEQSATLVVQVNASLAGQLGDYPHGWSVAGALRPAEGLAAGDCYDVSLIGPDHIGLIVLDIAGHGAGSAITALRCKELLKAALRSRMAPGQALQWLAGQDHGLAPGSFLTAIVADIDTTSGACRYANAGHPPPPIVGGAARSWAPTGPLFGPFSTTWATGTDELAPGEKLVVYTDGLTEARDEGRNFYGELRVTELLAETGCHDAQAVVKVILDDLDAFNAGRLHDDVTLIVVCQADQQS